MKKWQCVVCGWIYDEAAGAPEEGIAPGTRWEDVPDDFICPDCGVGKEDFEMVEILCLRPPRPVAVLPC
uniref:rubredoxin n=2 Tax=Thalassolituus TaxID=187492 RepID=UPI0026258087